MIPLTDIEILADKEYRALCVKAGLLPSEMREDPVEGLMVSVSGLRKLAALADNGAAGEAIEITARSLPKGRRL